MKREKIVQLIAVAGIVSSSLAVDVMKPSFTPPGNLPLDSVPQFICFGFDDNVYLDGVKWVDSLFMSKKNPDGSQVLATFYVSTHPDIENQPLWDYIDTVYQHGHEIGNHTQHHDAEKFNAEMNDFSLWDAEIGGANEDLKRQSNIPIDSITGFRTPFLGYSDATFEAMKKYNFTYDCSVEHFSSQYQAEDGSWHVGLVWPYTLENGVDKTAFKQGVPTSAPGMWELPVYEFQKMNGEWTGVTGFDWNLWFKGFKKDQVVELWKSSLKFRMEGYPAHDVIPNRAPFLLGVHSDIYTDDNEANATASEPTDVRRAAMVEFIDWALTYNPAVRIVPYKAVIEWMKNPVPYTQYKYGQVTPTGINTTKNTAKNIQVNSMIKNNAVSIKTNYSGISIVSIYTINGRLVSRIDNFKFTNGSNTVPLSTSLAQGTYIVSLSGDINYSNKIFVQ